MDSALGERYFTPGLTSAFQGAQTFKREVRKTDKSIQKDKVDDWLAGQEAYTLHKRIVNKFQRRNTIAASPGVQLQADLLDTQAHAGDNDGFRYILTIIDVVSKKAWAIPIKSKSGEDVSNALGRVLMETGADFLQTDKGKEFYNVSVSRVLDRFKVKHFSTENETIKASIVERFNQTLRRVLHRAFTKIGRNRYVDILTDVVSAYNDRYNASIGMAPNEMTPENQEDAWLLLNDNSLHFTSGSPAFSVGDAVRITKYRGVFQRGYTPNWSKEIFFVTKIEPTAPITYRLKDYAGEIIAGTFYSQELQKVKEPELYDVEKIIQRKKVRGRNMVLVKWMGYPDSFNQWVLESDVMDK